MGRSTRARAVESPATAALTGAIRALAKPLATPGDLDPLTRRVGDARVVLLGEASHGNSEYYRWRTEISKRLIVEKGFNFIAVEGDWPDCYTVNRYVKGLADSGGSARDVLEEFDRWPTWMWANVEVADLAEWLRRHNDGARTKVGFYGLDVYSLWDSLYQVMGYLGRTGGADAREAARSAFRCLEPFGEDEQAYARATRWVPESCEGEVVDLLRKVRGLAPTHPQDGDEAHFEAEQNALVAKNAEAYYRAMVRSGSESWNVRDRHMAETLDRLLTRHGPGAKAIVWEHNTHIGDARYTDMADDGMVNLGQLARERYGDTNVVLVGFGSYRGRVIAGDEWGEPWRRMRVPPGRPGSWEAVLHDAGPDDKLLVFPPDPAAALLESRGHRAIGVVYHPEFERFGNYVPTVLPRRYDAFLYLDETRALRPLHVHAVDPDEVPETYLTGV